MLVTRFTTTWKGLLYISILVTHLYFDIGVNIGIRRLISSTPIGTHTYIHTYKHSTLCAICTVRTVIVRCVILVGQETVAALCRLVINHKHQFEMASLQTLDATSTPSIKTSITSQGWVKVDLEENPTKSHRERAYGFSGSLHRKRADSDSSSDDLHSSSEGLLDSVPKKGPGTVTHTQNQHVNSFYTNVWKVSYTQSMCVLPGVTISLCPPSPWGNNITVSPITLG